MKRLKLSMITNLATVILTVYAWYLMLTSRTGNGMLASVGLSSLKYFTVLSNLFAGIMSVIWLAALIRSLKTGAEISERLQVLKLASATAVGLTFLTVLVFLGRIYGYRSMYVGANLWFHLIVPVTGMAEFTLLETYKKIPVRYAFLSALTSLIYGIGYLVNILINGVGIWPDTNDWYGFLNWGYAVGIAIFAVIVIMNFGSALLLRGVNNAVNKKARGD